MKDKTKIFVEKFRDREGHVIKKKIVIYAKTVAPGPESDYVKTTEVKVYLNVNIILLSYACRRTFFVLGYKYRYAFQGPRPRPLIFLTFYNHNIAFFFSLSKIFEYYVLAK